MKRNMILLVTTLLLMVVVWGMTMAGRMVYEKQDSQTYIQQLKR